MVSERGPADEWGRGEGIPGSRNSIGKGTEVSKGDGVAGDTGKGVGMGGCCTGAQEDLRMALGV